MISSQYLWGGLDRETAVIQKDLFERKRAKGYLVLVELKKDFNLLDFSQEQKDRQFRVNKIKKGIVFCNEQIDEAMEVLK